MAAFSAVVASGPSQAAETIAVFDFEIVRSNVIPGGGGHPEDEERRLTMIGERLRDRLADSRRFDVVDIAPVAAKAAGVRLYACGDCADDFARQVGAKYAFTGTVQKVSELILNINVQIHEAATSKRVAAASVDLRGNTDESWRRGMDYLYKNVLSPRLDTMLEK